MPLPIKLRLKLYALAIAYPLGLLVDIVLVPFVWAYRKLRRRRRM
jgi:hypothetical protein